MTNFDQGKQKVTTQLNAGRVKIFNITLNLLREAGSGSAKEEVTAQETSQSLSSSQASLAHTSQDHPPSLTHYQKPKRNLRFRSFFLKSLCFLTIAGTVVIVLLHFNVISLSPGVVQHRPYSHPPTSVPTYQSTVSTSSPAPIPTYQSTVSTSSPASCALPCLYQDALNDPNNQATVKARWDQTNSCSFAHDGYHIKQSQHYADSLEPPLCNETGHSYQDAKISVDTLLLSGASAALLVCAVPISSSWTDGYVFEIGADGRYRIYYHGDKRLSTNWMSSSSSIHTGDKASNTLSVIVQGSTLQFFANGNLLKSLVDAKDTEGAIGFITSTNDTAADVVFSNLSVYSV